MPSFKLPAHASVAVSAILLGLLGCEQPSSGPAPVTAAPPVAVADDGGAAAQPATVTATPATDAVVPATPTVDGPPATPEPLARLTAPPAAPDAEAQPAAVKLGIGDPAPPLAVAQWVTGEPLAKLEPGQIHVVEFWATWCGPCLASMPHISQLQTAYGDKVRFIGVTREAGDVVQKFLARDQSAGKTWREVITYRLALDQEDAMNAAYMRAAGQSGIPCAFVVGRDGAVEWIGHPMRIDEPLARIVSGEWDRAAAIAEFEEGQRLKAMQTRLSGLLRASKTDDALAFLDEMEQGQTPSPALLRLRWSILKKAGRLAEANAVLARFVEQVWNDANLLNEAAWSIATDRGEQRDLDLALKAAQRASELRQHEDGTILDTLARVYYEQRDLPQAVAWQRRAVKRAPENAELAATLKKYESESTPATDPPPAAP